MDEGIDLSNGGKPKKQTKSLEQIAEETLKKPAVPIVIMPPVIGDNNE